MIQKKKTTGKIASLWGLCLFCLCMVFCLLADMPVKAATSGDWEYEILENGTVEITSYNGKEAEVVIPGTIAGKSVKSIGHRAFASCSNLTSITIPSSVTSIGEYAFFDCNKLTSLHIPNSVSSIGDHAFFDCNSLTSINIPSSVSSIENYTFRGCGSLTSINIPSSVSSIGNGAFQYCDRLKSIEIPSSVTSIGSYAFHYCICLKSIKIPSSVSSIGASAFEGCSSLTNIEIPSSVLSIGEWAFYYCDSLKSIDIPGSVSSIGASAFSRCSSLTSVNIPGSVSSIGDYAFAHCSSLTSVNIPGSVSEIGKYTFYDCSSDLIIYGEAGSYAEKYAKENEMKIHLHTYQQTITKATTKKNGTIVNKCSACGSIKSTTDIYAASSIKLSKTSFTYNGRNKKPAVTVKDNKGNKLPAGSYKITYPKNSKKVGKYTVTITLQGNYSGTVKLTYQITPKGTSISKLTAKKKGFTAKWKKQMGQTTGYQLQYSTSKKFKGAKTVTVKKNKTVSKNIKKLKAGKKYYVRIRTYKTVKVNGKSVKLYSGWSKVKSVKTKK